MKNKFLIKFAIIICFLIVLPLLTNAGYEIEVSLPDGPQAGDEVSLTSYIDYLYKSLLAIVGLAAFGALVFGGFQYMLSDSITSKEEAKKWIWGALGGLLLALSAFLILYTINPELTEINPPTLDNINLPESDSTDADSATDTDSATETDEEDSTTPSSDLESISPGI